MHNFYYGNIYYIRISDEYKFQNQFTKFGIFTNPRLKDVVIYVFLTPVQVTEECSPE